MEFVSRLILSIDSSSSRVDGYSLSDQDRMELLIDGFSSDSKQRYKNDKGFYIDVCEWNGVKCDSKGSITRVEYYNTLDFTYQGRIELSYLPQTVVRVFGESLQLDGTVDAYSLPQSLEELMLPYARLSGCVEMSALPRNMRNLTLRNNLLEGEIDLTSLPTDLEFLDLSNNNFRGCIKLKLLPSKLFEVHLSSNHLCGNIDLNFLPDSLSDLYVDNNELCGEIEILHPPASLEMIDVSKNRFFGEARISRIVKRVNLQLNDIQSVIDEHGKKHMYEERMLSGDICDYSSD